MAPSRSNGSAESQQGQGRSARHGSSATQSVGGGRRDGARRKRASKNQRKGIDDRLIMPGKRLCRMVGFNWNIRLTLDRGLRRLGCESDEDLQDLLQNATAQEKLLDGYWEALVDYAPTIPSLVTSKIDEVEITLDYSKSTSRAEDNHKFKKGVMEWRKWTPGAQGRLSEAKKDRGLNHVECARLLCPINLNFANPGVRNDFMNNKNPPATHHVWPRCIYAGYTGTAKNPKVGLLRSNLMLRGAKAVLFSPSEAEGDGDARATRPSFAEINNINEVTRPFLAYVAVLLRYSLSSELTFVVHGPFNYGAFYDSLLSYLQDPEFKSDTDELIEWWNGKLFPEAQHARQNPDFADIDMHTLMRAEKARAEGGDAANNAVEGEIESEYEEEELV